MGNRQHAQARVVTPRPTSWPLVAVSRPWSARQVRVSALTSSPLEGLTRFSSRRIGIGDAIRGPLLPKPPQNPFGVSRPASKFPRARNYSHHPAGHLAVVCWRVPLDHAACLDKFGHSGSLAMTSASWGVARRFNGDRSLRMRQRKCRKSTSRQEHGDVRLAGPRVGEERRASASPPNVVSTGPVQHSEPQFCALGWGALCWPRTKCAVGPERTTIPGSGYLPRPPRTSPISAA